MATVEGIPNALLNSIIKIFWMLSEISLTAPLFIQRELFPVDPVDSFCFRGSDGDLVKLLYPQLCKQWAFLPSWSSLEIILSDLKNAPIRLRAWPLEFVNHLLKSIANRWTNTSDDFRFRIFSISYDCHLSVVANYVLIAGFLKSNLS